MIKDITYEKFGKKLTGEGYYIGLKNIDGVEYIFGRLFDHDKVVLNTEIWIRIKDDKYVFPDIIGQTAEEKYFDNEAEMVNYIKQKYPVN